jgi:hypothetical protein
MRRAALLLLPCALAGCGGDGAKETAEQRPAQTPAQGAAPWPAPPNPIQLTRKAGLTPETHEFLAFHVHAHLDVFVNGKPVTVPAAIGIETHDPQVQRFEDPSGISYGGINPPCATPCISPLHTHSSDGVLHTEAKKNEFNTLGEFFVEWNVPLSRKCIGGYCRPATDFSVYVDGEPYSGDPRAIKLEDQQEIAIVIGTPPPEIPSEFSGG